MYAAERDQRIHTALFNIEGESVEGAFVDHYVYYADTAREELVAHFTEQGFTDDDANAIRTALRQPGVPPEAGASLLRALHQWLPQEAEALYQESDPALRAIGVQILNRPVHWYEKKPVVPKGLADSSSYVRIATLKTLIENRRSVADYPAILMRMLEDPEPTVRRLVVKNLSFYQSPENQAALIKTWDSDPDQTVRNTVLRWVAEETRRLGVHYSPENVAEGIGEALTARLIAALEHSDPEMRATIARSLERVAGQAVSEAMVARLKVEADHDARCALLYYPRYREVSEAALPLLLDILHNKANASQQTLAAWLMPAFGPAVEPDLITTLSSNNALGPRRAAAMGLGRIGTLKSLPALLTTWRDPAMKFADREVERAIRDVVIKAAYRETPMPSAPDLNVQIQRLIDELEPERNSLREHCKTELNALLVHATQIYLWAICPDSTVLWGDHEAFARPSEPETEPLKIFAAWVHGAEKHREMAEGISQPPKSTEPCLNCRARGYSEQGDHCFTCSGLGWFTK